MRGQITSRKALAAVLAVAVALFATLPQLRADVTTLSYNTASAIFTGTTTFTGPVHLMDGTSDIAIGGSTSFGKFITVANVNTTSQATTGVIEEVLATYTLPANAFNTNGRAIRITAIFGGSGAGNKQVHLRFGGLAGTQIATMATSTIAGGYLAEALIFRTGSNAQATLGSASVTTVAPTRTVSTPSLTDTAAIDIAATATSATIGQITFRAMVVEFLN